MGRTGWDAAHRSRVRRRTSRSPGPTYPRRVSRIVPVIVAVGLIVFALVDCVRTPEDKVPARIAKPVWVILILLLPVIGAVAWILLSKVFARSPGGSGGTSGTWTPGTPPAGRPSRGPVAPDDDPEFLARLEADRRRTERERRQRERDAAKDSWGAAAGAATSDDAPADPERPADRPEHGDTLPGSARGDETDGQDGTNGSGGGVPVDDPRENPGSPA